MKYTFIITAIFIFGITEIGYTQSKGYLRVEEVVEKKEPEFTRPEDMKVLYIVDSVNFYTEEEFKALKLEDFDIEKKYFNLKNNIVNLIIIIRTKDNE